MPNNVRLHVTSYHPVWKYSRNVALSPASSFVKLIPWTGNSPNSTKRMLLYPPSTINGGFQGLINEQRCQSWRTWDQGLLRITQPHADQAENTRVVPQSHYKTTLQDFTSGTTLWIKGKKNHKKLKKMDKDWILFLTQSWWYALGASRRQGACT